MPVARKRPRTLPPSVMPVFSKRKTSCSVMMSCSMPTTSVMWVIRRGPALETGDLHKDFDRRGDLLADGTDSHIGIGHAHHDLESPQAVARGVGVDRGERSIRSE